MPVSWQFQERIHVVCPSCSGQAIMGDGMSYFSCLSCGYNDRPPTKRNAGKRLPVRCPGCGKQVTPKDGRYQTKCYDCRTEIPIREDVWDWEPVVYWAETSTRFGTIFAYNPEHLKALRDYIASDRHHPFDPETGTHRLPNKDWRSRLPQWMKLAKNRKDVLKALDRLEARFAEKS